MNDLQQLVLLLQPPQQCDVLLLAARTAISSYSIYSEHNSNYAEVLTWERSGELSLEDRLLDCMPLDGYPWIHCDLFDLRHSVFESAWGDTGEQWLQAIIGPPECDEFNASELEEAVAWKFESSEDLPSLAERIAPSSEECIDFIRDWRAKLIARLNRKIPLNHNSQSDIET